jgi:putative tryptophan/tyrosine transport system substrate-binding protein
LGYSMRRRDFITVLGGAAAWPIAARAQQQSLPVIGFLGSDSPEAWAGRLRSFRQGLGETGFVEGRNVAIEYRWAAGKNGQLPALATDLVRRQVAVIATPGSTSATLAAKAATSTIPIVFSIGSDPVAFGFVASFNRPGGNLTGVTVLTVEMGPKRLELFHELVPSAGLIALLINPTSPLAAPQTKDFEAAAKTLGLDIRVMQASTEGELDSVFATLARLQAGGLVISADSFFSSRDQQIAAAALGQALPTMSQFREFAAAGGLMSYAASIIDAYRQAGVYTGRILKGEKPADLPIAQPTMYELVINLRTAKALGIKVPQTLLISADEIIE